MSLIAEALGLGCKVHGTVCGDTTLMHHDDHPFLEGLDVRDKARVCCCGVAHDRHSALLSLTGNLMPSMMSLFWASLIPAE